MSHARTLWEEGREPGHQVVALGVALALTAVTIDLGLIGRLSLLFDICFVLVCAVLALMIRPNDFFVTGVLPPLLMVSVFVLLAAVQPESIARAEDSVVQAVVTGLAHHAVALMLGYAACLAVLVQRQRLLAAD